MFQHFITGMGYGFCIMLIYTVGYYRGHKFAFEVVKKVNDEAFMKSTKKFCGGVEMGHANGLKDARAGATDIRLQLSRNLNKRFKALRD